MFVKRLLIWTLMVSITLGTGAIAYGGQQKKQPKTTKEENMRLRAERKKAKVPVKKVKKDQKKKKDYPFNQ